MRIVTDLPTLRPSTGVYSPTRTSWGVPQAPHAVPLGSPTESFSNREVIHETENFLENRARLLNEMHINRNSVELPQQKKTKKTVKKPVTQKAEQVRKYLEIYYETIGRYQKEVTPIDELSCVWNPVQVIRDRRLRYKYGDKVRGNALPIPRVKLASRQFSRHERGRLIWEVRLHEYLIDIEWRAGHWRQLRNAKGEKWMSEKRHRERRAEEKLGVEKNRVATDKDGGVGEEAFSSNEGELVRRSGNHSHSETILSVRDGSHIDGEEKKEGEEGKEEVGAEDREGPDDLDNGVDDGVDGMGGSLVNGHAITRHHHNHDHLHDNSGSRREGTVESSILRECGYYAAVSLELVRVVNDCLSAVSGSTHSLRVEESVLRERVKRAHVRETHLQDSVAEVLGTVMDDANKLLESVSLLENDIEQARNSSAMEDAIVEELLGYCDRSSGEINTSIGLELRALEERAGRLSGSSLETHGSTLGNTLFEGLIVCLLWGVWIIVETWLLLTMMVKRTVLVLKWLLI